MTRPCSGCYQRDCDGRCYDGDFPDRPEAAQGIVAPDWLPGQSYSEWVEACATAKVEQELRATLETQKAAA